MSEAFAVIDDGAGSPPPADEPSFTRLSVHQSHEDALAAMELVEGDRYLFLYNNGSRGHNAVPAAPTHWHVTKEFSVKNRGQVLREHVPGHVDRWLENGGRYQWKVKFSTGKVELMDAEQLAAAVAYSHALGMRVIP
ncbi:hypothetical protein GN958_ATG10953 [Phytophthora infestans]|uniref:Uncharacterized protein n=1 Tax=Phytophthora infestans TaxID=4787 RepID=A0A8S9UFK0_PHYIN|nr:hypothetical protein GN958_ATG10953 [Phytophthora infestans]